MRLVRMAAAAAAVLVAGCAPEPLPVAADVDPAAAAITAGVPVVAEFGANVCAACRDMKAVLAEVRQTRGARVRIVEIDPLKQRELAARYRIQLMPTQVFFDREGREVGRNVGRMEAGTVLRRLDAAEAP